MSQIKTDRSSVPVDREHDPELVAFRAQIDDRSPFDELIHRSHRHRQAVLAHLRADRGSPPVGSIEARG